MFDEPLSNLDRELRENYGHRDRTASQVANLGLTAIYVTHDQSEAFSLADQAVMRAGVIEQLAAPEALVAEPTTPEVADFQARSAVSFLVERRENAYRIARTEIHIAHGSHAGQATHVLLPSRLVRSAFVHEAADPGNGPALAVSRRRSSDHTVRIGSQQDGHELTYLDSIRLSPGSGRHLRRCLASCAGSQNRPFHQEYLRRQT